jgi:V8-like Glu-specific endopeptidase
MDFVTFRSTTPFVAVGITTSLMACLSMSLAPSLALGTEILSKEATPQEGDARRAFNYAGAKPLLRLLKQRPTATPEEDVGGGTPGFSPGQAPTIAPSASQGVQLTPPQAIESEPSAISPRNFGTLNHPFTTARVATKVRAVNPAIVFPYLPAGKLFFEIDGSAFVCSAAVIKPRVVVTAAHCVSEFGANKFYSNFRFAPGYTNGRAPVGVWSYKRVFVKKSYLNGTDPCFSGAVGIVCASDVAVFVMNDRGGKKIGSVTGTFGFGFNNYGYVDFLRKRVNQLTQLGYPVDLDRGLLMQRTDSLSYIDGELARNQIIGSLMTGGSSGGPWLVNFGMAPSAPGLDPGQAPRSNVVVGVTSWGYESASLKEMGASRFTDRNIVPLVQQACAADRGNC